MASLNYNIADEYEQSKSYSSGDIIIKDKELYFAKSNISANTPFSEDDWQKVFLADLLRGHLNSNLGGGYNLTNLWNASDAQCNSSFNAQTISIDLSSYKAIMISVSYSIFVSGNATIHSIQSDIIEIGKSKECFVYYPPNRTSSNYSYYSKRTITVSKTGITFSDGYNSYSGNVNTVCIPLQIYGIK